MQERAARAPSVEAIRRILCMRPDGLGDMVCATPGFDALAEAFPEASLTVLASPLNAPLLVGNPRVRDVLLYEPKGRDRSMARRLRLLREIRCRRFDLVVALRTAWDTHLIAALSGARYRAGYTDKPFARRFTHRLVGGHVRGTRHEIDRNLNLLDTLGVRRVTRKPRLYLLDEERKFAETWLRERELTGSFLLGIHVGASASDRCYPESRYAEAANDILHRLGRTARALVFGGPNDGERVAAVQRGLDVPCASSTALSIREFMALTERCSLMLVNDSGPMHIAAALNAPLAALFGPGDHVRWMPENANALLVRPDANRAGALPPVAGQSNLVEIPVEWVVEAGWSALGASRLP